MVTKKLTALVLALTLVCTLTVPASAAERTENRAKPDAIAKATATAIQVNTTYTSRNADYYETKDYRFSLSKAGRIHVDFSHDYFDASSTYWYIAICDAQKEEISYEWIPGSAMKTTTVKTGLPAGTYYLRVEAKDDYAVNRNYRFKINYAASSVWEKEFNDTKQQCNSISLNKTYYGTSRKYEDEDYYRITVPQSGTLQVLFHHSYVDSGSHYWTVSFYNAAMKELTAKEIYGNETKNKLCKLGLPKGTYFIKVESNHDSKIPYNLKASFSSSSLWEKEFNDTPQTANPISLNGTRYGTSSKSSWVPDDDYYKLKADKSGYMTLNFKHPYRDDSDLWKVSLYNGAMQPLYEDQYIPARNTVTNLPRIAVRAGRAYYIRIYGYYEDSDGLQYTIKPVYRFTKSVPTLTLKSGKKKAFLSWEKVPGANGYQVYMRARGSSKYKLVKTTSARSLTKTGLTSNKRYYFKIRAYKTIKGKKYSSNFCSVKSVIVK